MPAGSFVCGESKSTGLHAHVQILDEISQACQIRILSLKVFQAIFKVRASRTNKNV